MSNKCSNICTCSWTGSLASLISSFSTWLIMMMMIMIDDDVDSDDDDDGDDVVVVVVDDEWPWFPMALLPRQVEVEQNRRCCHGHCNIIIIIIITTISSIIKVTSVKSSKGTITWQGHISQVHSLLVRDSVSEWLPSLPERLATLTS